MFGKRYDGTRIKGLPAIRRIIPFLMKKRNESILYFKETIDLSNAFVLLRELNKEARKPEDRFTLFHIYVAAAVRLLSLRPELNRFVSNYRYYQRNNLTVCFVAKKEMTDEGEEINVKIHFDLEETLYTVKAKLDKFIQDAKSSVGTVNDATTKAIMRFPNVIVRPFLAFVRLLDRWNLATGSMIEPDPFFCSLFLTNLGSIWVDAPYHHLFEWGNCPIFVAIGPVKKEDIINAAGAVEKKKKVTMTFSIDDRISDGFYLGNSLSLIKGWIRQPGILLQPPDIDDTIRKQHKLKR